MKKLTSIPGFLWDKGAMEDGGRRIWLTTQELSDEQLSVVMKYGSGKEFGFFTFKLGENEIQEEELVDLPEVKMEFKKDKSPSQRLRNTIYVYWEQNGATGEFDSFYKRQMNLLIERIKSKLD